MELPEYAHDHPLAGLSIDELQRSELAGDRYKNVTVAQLFSSTSDARLAAEVRKNDPIRYRLLRREHQVAIGIIHGDLVPAAE